MKPSKVCSIPYSTSPETPQKHQHSRRQLIRSTLQISGLALASPLLPQTANAAIPIVPFITGIIPLGPKIVKTAKKIIKPKKSPKNSQIRTKKNLDLLGVDIGDLDIISSVVQALAIKYMAQAVWAEASEDSPYENQFQIEGENNSNLEVMEPLYIGVHNLFSGILDIYKYDLLEISPFGKVSIPLPAPNSIQAGVIQISGWLESNRGVKFPKSENIVVANSNQIS